ncbi:hypothetical protein [Nonomuraea lactucae]|uniref:hypothetical protein n=1 Tax=Nonomuraea lactucae TaxID=2249762 RepID=UPI0013B3D2CF|nr:hypothetical protein [Nonomuraea lactucae]
MRTSPPAVLAAVVMLAGCASPPPRELTPPPPTVSTASPSPTPTPTTRTSGIARLVGTWVATGTSDFGTAELVYRFAADGTYKHASVVMQPRPAGVFSFTVAAKGRATVRGDTLTLRPTWGTRTLKDPEDPSRDYARPLSSLAPERYRMQWSGTALMLTGKNGSPLHFERQD